MLVSVGLGVLSIRIWDGWLYLAVIIDLFSRRTIGWSMQPHLRTQLALEAGRVEG